MRQVSLREFRTRGSAALKAVPPGETILLAGQKGPAYFLVPVQGDVITADRELRIAMARASLRDGWERIEASGLPALTDEEIDAEIAEVRKARVTRKRSTRR
jgi:antitoxin (DNA-binding transcriptional repressor) of toxin-antitoxin stability system